MINEQLTFNFLLFKTHHYIIIYYNKYKKNLMILNPNKFFHLTLYNLFLILFLYIYILFYHIHF